MFLKHDDHTKTPEAGGGARGLIIAFVLVAVCAVIVYSGAMRAPFVFDDEFIIMKNPMVHDLARLWPPFDPRYIGYLSFALNYRFGGLDTFGYHLVNVAIHIINGLLVYALVVCLFRAARSAGYATVVGRDPMVPAAIVSALLFTVHPVNIQAVTYVVQRFASLATLFYLLSLVLYLEWKRSCGRKGSKRAAALYILSLLSAVAAHKTKEIAFTLPFVIVLLDLAVFPEKDGGVKKRLPYLIPFLLTLFVIPASMVLTALAHTVPAGAGRELASFVPNDLKEIPPYDYLLTQFRVIITYLRLLVLPVGQNLDYEYTVYRSLLSPAPLLGLLFHLGALCFASYLFIRARAGKNLYALLVSVGVFWFYITISIESSVIPLRDVIFEHRVYLPGVGLFLSFAAAFFYCFGRLASRFRPGASAVAATVVLLCLSAVPLGAASYMRNLVWSDIVAFYEDTARKSPGNARAHNNLGVEYGKLGMNEEAIEEFKATLRLKPDFIDTYKNLANAYYLSGRTDEAIDEYEKALRLAPRDKVARKNLADLYYEKGSVQSAVREYETVLRLYPDYVSVRNNLGNIFLSEGRLEEAVREYEKVLSVKPDHVETIYNMAIALERSGNPDAAAYYYRRFVETAPAEYQSHKDEVRSRLRSMGPR